MSTSDFAQNNQLLLGILYDSIVEYSTFTHARSIFKDKWYNFLVPKVGPEKLDWHEVNRVIEDERSRGFDLSYYVPEEFYQDYKAYFVGLGKDNQSESDFYVFADNVHTPKILGEFILVDDSNIEEFVKIDQICFPEWENSGTYSRHFYRLQQVDKNHIVRNYLYRVDGRDVGVCGWVGSTELSLAYIHNTGILPEYRRQGYFSNMIRYLMNLSLDNHIAQSFALVDESGASFPALQKLGFETKIRYYLFDL